MLIEALCPEGDSAVVAAGRNATGSLNSTADVASAAQARGDTGPAVGDAIRAARIEAVAAALG